MGVWNNSTVIFEILKIIWPFFTTVFPTQGLNLGLLHCRQVVYCLRHQGSPGELTMCQSGHWGCREESDPILQQPVTVAVTLVDIYMHVPCARDYISLAYYLVWFPKQSFELDFIVRILWKAIDTDWITSPTGDSMGIWAQWFFLQWKCSQQILSATVTKLELKR